MGSAPSVLSIVRLTSARPSGGRAAVPAKMTSSILPPRRLFAPCSPMTQLRASATLDLPDPFGPTTQVMPGSRRKVVAEANDLKPRSVRVFRCTSGGSSGGAVPYRPPSSLTPRDRWPDDVARRVGPRVGRSGRMEAMDEAIAVRGGPSLTTDRAAELPRAVAAAVVAWAVAAVPLLAVLPDADRGVDAMDESHYLLAAQPWASTSAFDGVFGWYLGILLRILGDDVARLRVVAALVLVLASLPAARATRRAAETVTGDPWPSWLRAVWPAAISAGSLCFYVVYVRTPGYNWFAEVGLLLVAAGLAALVVASGPESVRGVAVAAVPLGAGLAVTAIGKTTSAAGALAVVAVASGILPR